MTSGDPNSQRSRESFNSEAEEAGGDDESPDWTSSILTRMRAKQRARMWPSAIGKTIVLLLAISIVTFPWGFMVFGLIAIYVLIARRFMKL